jgi:hypothetical protein
MTKGYKKLRDWYAQYPPLGFIRRNKMQITIYLDPKEFQLYITRNFECNKTTVIMNNIGLEMWGLDEDVVPIGGISMVMTTKFYRNKYEESHIMYSHEDLKDFIYIGDL